MVSFLRCSLILHEKLPVFCLNQIFFSRVPTVVLPPEKAEGCESYLQYVHTEDGEREILRDATKAAGKKRISLDVSCNIANPSHDLLSITVQLIRL